MNAVPTIAVIIPFFQRESGILARSLASIADQGYPSDKLYVLVIDDGSPVPAADELIAHPPPPGLRVQVIRQANAGPNEARNRGLESLAPGTDLVAYLDSDDEWINDHLRRAVRTLERGGYNAYFANLYHLGDDVDEYQKAKRIRIEDHPPLDGDATLRSYEGDMVHQIATANIIFMPTLVIRVDVLGMARFPQGHRNGGGDYLYWMDLIAHGARFAFSTVAEVRCGRGINMWYGSGWGTDGLALRILDEARFRRRVLVEYARADVTRQELRLRLAELQVGMLQDMMHRLRRHKPVNWGAARTLFRTVPPSSRMVGKMVGTLLSAFGSRSR